MHSNQNIMEKQVFKMEAKLTQLQVGGSDVGIVQSYYINVTACLIIVA